MVVVVTSCGGGGGGAVDWWWWYKVLGAGEPICCGLVVSYIGGEFYICFLFNLFSLSYFFTLD